MTDRTNKFSRRDSFKLAGAAGLLGWMGLGSAAHADDAKTLPAIQGAGFYRRKLGDLELILVSDGGFPMPLGFMLPNADNVEAVAKQAYIGDVLPGHVNTLVVKSGAETLLIDTGAGNAFGPTTGKLLENLQRAGIAPADITKVLITHAHPDHMGLLLGGKLVFDKAQFFVSEPEMKFWQGGKADLSKSPVGDDMKKTVIGAGKAFTDLLTASGDRAGIIQPKQELVPGVTVELAPGHTPGHVIVNIASGNDSLLYITDAIHMLPLQMIRPDWKIVFDTDPVQSVETRKKILDRCVSDRVLVAGSHLPFPGFGHIDKVADHYAWVPVVWEW